MDLYREYGYYQEGAKSLTLKGKEGADKIQAIMDGLRSSPPKSIGDIPVKTVADITTGEIKAVQTGKVLGRYELPSSNVMMFVLEDETKVIVRPSGTEPKIKFYVLTKEADSDLEKARATATDRIKRIAADMTKDA
jgi:phosphoglucomutase